MLARFLFIIFLALAAATARADRFDDLLGAAVKALNGGDYKAAEASARDAVAEAEKTYGAEHPETAAGLNLLGASLSRQARYGEAEAAYRRALAIYETRLGKDHAHTGVALNNLALTLERLGRYQDAESMLRRSLELSRKAKGESHPDTAKIIGNLGRVLDAQGKVGEKAALAGSMDKAPGKAAAPAPGGAPASPEEAQRLAREAEAALGRGDIRGAEALQQKVAALHEKTLGPDHLDTARSYANLANTLALAGRPAEAEKIYRRVLAVREKALGEDHPDTAVTLANLGYALHQQGKQADLASQRASRGAGAVASNDAANDAEGLLRRAMAIQEKTLSPDHPALATTRNNLAVVLESLGRYPEAEEMHRRALESRRKVLGPEHPDAAASLTNLSVVMERQGHVAEAEALHREAVELSRKSGDLPGLAVHAARLAYALAHRGRLSEALPWYQEALDALDALFARTRGLSESGRQGAVARLRPVYVEALDLLARLAREKPDGRFERQALAVASRNQSRVFTEMLRQAAVAKVAGTPEFQRLRDQHLALTARVAQLAQARASVPLSDPGGAARRDDLGRQLDAARKQLGGVEDGLWRQYPRYMELTQPRAVSADDLQARLLKPGEALLMYALLPRSTLVFAATRERLVMKQLPLTQSAVAARVRDLRRPMEQVAGGEPALLLRLVRPEDLNSLYRDLVAPVADVLQGAKRVLVVPDGALHTFPFEALVTRYEDADRKAFEDSRRDSDSRKQPFLAAYGKLAYLGQQYRLSYLPSLATLAAQRLYPKPAAAAGATLVAFADPVFTRGDAPGGAIPRLPDTADEARDAATAMGGQSKIFLRENAQEKAVKAGALKGARYALFATHGFLGGEWLPDPDEDGSPGGQKAHGLTQPALALTRVGELGGDDGFLTMGEVIETLDLSADLVALSACNTAGESDRARNGEGFAGLTRAFMYAGARSLLVSHWSVETQATRKLVAATFRQMAAGAPTTEALATARSEVMGSTLQLGDTEYSRAHPFFWAPFVLVGD